MIDISTTCAACGTDLDNESPLVLNLVPIFNVFTPEKDWHTIPLPNDIDFCSLTCMRDYFEEKLNE